jgi:hypothetical protein
MTLIEARYLDNEEQEPYVDPDEEQPARPEEETLPILLGPTRLVVEDNDRKDVDVN